MQIHRKQRARKRRRAIRIFALLCILVTFVVILMGQAKPHIEKTDTISQLQQISKSDGQIESIIKNISRYPDDLIKSLIKNPEMLNFVLHYNDKKDSNEVIRLTNDEINAKTPLFLQWDERWGYSKYGDDIIALTGCGPTCLSMVIVGVTGNVSANPREVAKFSAKSGYYVLNKGTDWGLLTTGAKVYGLTAKEIPLSESVIIQEIQNGHPIICCMGPGDFTTTGHFIVIYGYENGCFLIHDPNSIERSSKSWNYNAIKNQIRNLWAYSRNV
ncbi:MAG: C39 family peptidase [Clostridia bacterium]|jgi:hypothetical protein